MKFPRITISGARGIVGKDLTVENAQRMAWAYAQYIGGGDVVLGRDARPTGELIKSAVISGLLAGGARVIDIGMVPTPTVGIMIRKLNAKGGIEITASHNPVPWNALKMYSASGSFPEQSFVDGYIAFLNQGDLKHVTWEHVQELTNDNSALETHIQLVEKAIDFAPIQQKNFTVLVDGCRSVGGIFLPELLRRMGCTVIEHDCQPDGKFTRGLEPVPENLTEVSKRVLAENADIGLIADPDADRMAIISEEGRAIGEEFTLALAAYGALQKHQGGVVVTNLSTSMLTEFAAKQSGGSVIRTAIGEAHVAKGIIEHHAIIGGEGNGGVMFPAVHNGRDTMTAAALILLLLAETGKKVSELVKDFPAYVILKDKITMDLDRANQRLETLATMDHDATVDTQDGVKLIWDNAWLHLRCSNTEPIVRIIAEAEGEDKTAMLIQRGRELMLT